MRLLRKTLFLALLLLGLPLLVFPRDATAQRVFVLAGQSNMLGRGDSAELGAEYADPQPTVRLWKGAGWRDLAPGTGVGRAHGPELSLGRALAEHYGEPIYLVKHAEGASGLAPNPSRPEKSWDPATGQLYPELRAKVESALTDLGSNAVVEGFFWMQGEADSKDPAHADAYFTRFQELIGLARQDFASPDMAVVLGRVNGRLHPSPVLGEKYQYVAQVRAAQERAAQEIPATAWVNTDELELNDDHLHFSSSGQIRLGQLMAEAFLQMTRKDAARPGGEE